MTRYKAGMVGGTTYLAMSEGKLPSCITHPSAEEAIDGWVTVFGGEHKNVKPEDLILYKIEEIPNPLKKAKKKPRKLKYEMLKRALAKGGRLSDLADASVELDKEFGRTNSMGSWEVLRKQIAPCSNVEKKMKTLLRKYR